MLLPVSSIAVFALLAVFRSSASKSSGYTDWTLLYDGSDLNAFGEVVIDELRVKADNVLSFMYQEKSSGT